VCACGKPMGDVSDTMDTQFTGLGNHGIGAQFQTLVTYQMVPHGTMVVRSYTTLELTNSYANSNSYNHYELSMWD
jgi:hypothetical protein